MAAIDKIYTNNWKHYLQFKEWCEKQPKMEDKYHKFESITKYLYKYDTPFTDEHPIFNAPHYIDAYVIRHCPFDFIQKELMINYGHWTQEQIDEAYKIVMDRGGEKAEIGNTYYWLTKNDFEIINGVITMPYKEKSSYQLIKEYKLYISPITSIDYTIGKHFRCIQHPKEFYNKPYNCKSWFIDINLPEGMGYMWYHEKYNTWDFYDEYVISDWASSTAFCKTIKALKRLIIRWKLPIGTIITATGRYTNDTYKFIVTK